ncbi:hypothetical protein B0H11DRAFT_288820 [Mycena galericulata]|nr:hypothetical protein B0H11DRAFT_288820 [Mycena galericulata]
MFPPEIVDLILDFLHTECTTLAACSLVCREWLPSARFHLFSQIDLDCNNIGSFFDDLDVVGTPSSSRFLKFAATGLGNVTSLRIDGLNLSDAPGALPQAFPNLESLSLKAFEADSFSVVATWLLALPSLRSLTLSGDWDGDKAETLPISGPTLPNLAHLDLDCPLKVFLGWFLSLAVVPVTPSLVLRDIWEEESPTVHKYLAAAGDVLDTLMLVYPRKEYRCLHLTQITSLRTLTFECYSHAMLRLVFHSLLVPHPGHGGKLENLCMTFLGMYSSFPTEDDLLEWLDLNDSLRGAQLHRLRRIEFRGLNHGVEGKSLLPNPIGSAVVIQDP